MGKRELSRLHSKSWVLPLPLDRRKRQSHRRWKYWLNEEKDELTVTTDQGVEDYSRALGGRR